ncbi:MAG: 5'-deoxynucleotidase [Clostridia bacterium]|nr:5'-deoxynucleotidase [Clostridia bacterium]
MNGFFAILNRLKYINRWGLMHCVRSENVMEHSAMVAMLAHCLAVLENKLSGEDLINPERAALSGLYHETAEVLTGDLPTPVKYYNAAITKAYKEIERGAEERIAKTVPPELTGELKGYISQDKTAKEGVIVKAADKIAALIKCREELKAGNAEFAGAEKSTLAELESSPLKSVRYFLDEMLPAYELTLDELQQ